MRKFVELHDKKCHFLHTISTSGGAGSGMAQFLIGCFGDYFPGHIHHQFQIVPSMMGNYCPTDIYNSILTNAVALYEPDLIIMVDNQVI